MTQRYGSKRKVCGLLSQRFLQLGGVGLLGGLGVFSAGIAFAQTPQTQPSSATSVVPSAQDLLSPLVQNAAPAPREAAPVNLAPAEISPSKPNPTESAPSISIELNQSAPASARPSVLPSSLANPVGQSPQTPSSSAAGAIDNAVENTPSSAPALVSPNLENSAKAAFSGGSYIDNSKAYSLGATQADDPNVVLSERSTGCQTVLKPGQGVPDSICPHYATASGEGSGNPSVNVGPLSLSVYGIGTGSAPPSGQDFYNLTVRPAAMISNGNISLMFPLTIPAAITSAFGWRMHPILGASRFHSGTDLGAPLGTPVVAAFAGKVSIADFLGGYGLAVVIQHDNDTEETLYGHMSELFVKPGEVVKQGDVIGRVGSTGLSTGPHLHFEFRKLTPEGWVVMDPGQTLQYAMGQLVKSLQTAQANPKQLFLISWESFSRALKMVDAKPQIKPSAKQVTPQVNPVGLGSED